MKNGSKKKEDQKKRLHLAAIGAVTQNEWRFIYMEDWRNLTDNERDFFIEMEESRKERAKLKRTTISQNLIRLKLVLIDWVY
jgi:hypothetical protein